MSAVAEQLAELLARPTDPRTVPVRFSNLKLMALSAEHYLHAVQSADGIKSPSLELGSAVDSLVYGTQRVMAYPGPVRRGKEYDAFCEDNDDALILTAKQLATAQAMARGIERNPKAVLARDGQRQRTLDWRIGQRACRGTPDCFTETRVVDLKTTRSSDPDRFRYDARRYGYNAQLAWYMNGLLLSGAASPEEALIVAVESRPPHTTTVFRLTERALDLGIRAWRLWWERLAVCEQSDYFPGYREGIVDLEIDDDSGAPFSLEIGGETFEFEG